MPGITSSSGGTIVREELSETIHLNETLGAPSARAMEKLFAKIDAEPVRRPAVSPNLGARLAGFFANLTPRQLAWSASAAALVPERLEHPARLEHLDRDPANHVGMGGRQPGHRLLPERGRQPEALGVDVQQVRHPVTGGGSDQGPAVDAVEAPTEVPTRDRTRFLADLEPQRRGGQHLDAGDRDGRGVHGAKGMHPGGPGGSNLGPVLQRRVLV